VAQKIQTLFVDDIDGSEAEGTVRFGLESTDYEIDLSVPHREELDKALAPYIAHARKVGSTRQPARSNRRSASTIDTHKVREWAKEQGIEIKERGRIPANIMAQYRDATGH
jgi:Lsr2